MLTPSPVQTCTESIRLSRKSWSRTPKHALASLGSSKCVSLFLLEAPRGHLVASFTRLNTSTVGQFIVSIAFTLYLYDNNPDHPCPIYCGLCLLRDGLGNATQTHPDINVPLSVIESQTHPQLEPTNRPGFLVGLDMLREFPAREITYIVLGPMTNLALMMREDAQCVRDKIGRVVVMGGALDVPGNTSPVAECKESLTILMDLDWRR